MSTLCSAHGRELGCQSSGRCYGQQITWEDIKPASEIPGKCGGLCSANVVATLILCRGMKLNKYNLFPCNCLFHIYIFILLHYYLIPLCLRFLICDDFSRLYVTFRSLSIICFTTDPCYFLMKFFPWLLKTNLIIYVAEAAIVEDIIENYFIRSCNSVFLKLGDGL